MLDIKLTVEKSAQIVGTVIRARQKYGKHASYPYRIEQIIEAMVTLQEASTANGEASLAAIQEELTLVKRQLAACSAREVKRSKSGERDEFLS